MSAARTLPFLVLLLAASCAEPPAPSANERVLAAVMDAAAALAPEGATPQKKAVTRTSLRRSMGAAPVDGLEALLASFVTGRTFAAGADDPDFGGAVSALVVRYESASMAARHAALTREAYTGRLVVPNAPQQIAYTSIEETDGTGTGGVLTGHELLSEYGAPGGRQVRMRMHTMQRGPFVLSLALFGKADEKVPRADVLAALDRLAATIDGALAEN